MAAHELGKLKFKFSKDGLAFKYGDGKTRRIGLGKKNRDDDPDAYEENYSDADEYAEEEDFEPEFEDEYTDEGSDDFIPEGYNGRFSRAGKASYQDESYDEDAGFEDEYEDDYDDDYDDRYDDRYDDEESPDAYYDDEYSDEEYDDGYYDEDGDYDDRYLDEDAENYDDEPYAEESPFLRYVDENDWITYLLLFILPPLGIYLLWRRMKFEKPIRWAVSIASGIWFIILLILLISGAFGGSDDTRLDPTLTFTTPAPTNEINVSADDDIGSELPNSEGIEAVDSLLPDASATPIPSSTGSDGNTGAAANSNIVYMPASGFYYHSKNDCAEIPADTTVSKVTKEVAAGRKMAPCPVCYSGQTYCYATASGKYYHYDEHCSGMQDAGRITVALAEAYGKPACPACVTGKVNTLSDNALKFADSNTKDKSGITVYATKNGKYFHTNSTCSDMQGASATSLLKAMIAGKTACPTCCASAGQLVYATEGGKYYHSKSNCTGMQHAYRITLAEAAILGKGKCPVCLKASVNGDMSVDSIMNDNTIYVYGTKGGTYYHTKSNCSGMSGATKYTLKSMIVSGRKACPTCCTGANTTVYATSGGTYYHSYATCSGIKNANAGTLAQALAYGYQKCPKCWGGSSSSKKTSASSASSVGSSVYCTKKGTYYHTKSNCSGMTGASKVSLSSAVSAGKKPCPTCAGAAGYNVYSTEKGKYYHATSNCSGMQNAKKRTLQAALLLGQTACPTCVSNYQAKTENAASKAVVLPNQKSSGTYKSGTSGIKVYATATSKHFHTKSGCSGMTDASYITLETALNYGKTPCMACASSANSTVYAVKGGKYYHYSKACAGSGASKGTRAEALAYGYDPCPYCVSKTKAVTSSNTYKSGKSGIKVYASLSGKYYHTDKTCAGRSASRVTLETALNYGKRACPSCSSAAAKTVYSTAKDKYYHSSKTCAGSGSATGTFAQALAMGKKECPICIGGSESYEVSDIKYSAASGTGVYVDLDSSMFYYHKGKKCSDAGLSGGTKVTLEFVLKMGYKACPYCNPPTSIKK